MRRVIFTEAHSRLWLDIALTLRREVDLEPCYWVGKAHYEPVVREHFPGAVFHARTHAIRAMPAPAMASAPMRPLDADILRRFSQVLITAGKMMDRLDPGDGFRYEERARVFHLQLRYWRMVVERFEPDLVVFPVQPHTVYDYILFELCHAYGVRTSMFQWTLFPDWIYPLDDIEHGYEEIATRYARLVAAGRDVALSPRAQDYLERVAGDYRGAVPNYLVRAMPDQLRQELFGRRGDHGLMPDSQSSEAAPAAPDRSQKDVPRLPSIGMALSSPARARKHVARYVNDRRHRSRRALRRAGTRGRRAATRAARVVHPRSVVAAARRAADVSRRWRKAGRLFYKRWFRHIVRGVLEGDVDRPLKEHGRRIHESFRGRWGAVRLQIWRWRGYRKKRALLKAYLSRCRPHDLAATYVFVALHYQPEQTTSPTGSVFVDQVVMVEMLSRLVPQGWRVYVKEHPFQFFATGVGERSRTVDVYDDLAALPNVTLVPWSVSPFELIDGARAVATVTGTTGIEAAMRGKPVLAFGYAWYRDCEGVFYTPSIAACRDALRRIAGGYVVDSAKVRQYLKAVEDSCFQADLGFGERLPEPIAHEDNVARLASAIASLAARPARATQSLGQAAAAS